VLNQPALKILHYNQILQVTINSHQSQRVKPQHQIIITNSKQSFSILPAVPQRETPSLYKMDYQVKIILVYI
jgi:hypothetical protein